MKHVGEEIRNRRKQLRLTQTDVAGENMSISKLSNIENGKLLPDPATWKHLQKKLGLSEDLLNHKQVLDQIRFMLEQAETYEATQLIERAEAKYRQCIELCERALLYDKAGQCCRKLANIQMNKMNHAKAIESLKKALEMFERTGNWERAAECEMALTRVYYQMEQFERALQLARRTLQRIPEDDETLKGRVHYNVASVCYRMQMFDEANFECDQALSYLRKDEKRYRMAALILQGILLKRARMYTFAENRHEEAKTLALQLNDTGSLGVCWHNLGDVAMESGLYAKAQECFNTAVEVKRENGDQQKLVRTYAYIAELFRRMNRPEEALKLAEWVLAETRKSRLKTDEFLIVKTLSLIWKALGDEQRFLDLSYKAMTLADRLSFRYEKAQLLERTAHYYHGIGDEKRCVEKLHQAFLIKSADEGEVKQA
ncbi:MAG TPA: tetratricopeptide repeat protein [Bacillales bacterium]|nr:tetratricopeptide repeat protein [Bacillales bacterium]